MRIGLFIPDSQCPLYRCNEHATTTIGLFASHGRWMTLDSEKMPCIDKHLMQSHPVLPLGKGAPVFLLPYALPLAQLSCEAPP